MPEALQVPRLHRPPVVARAFAERDAALKVEASADPLIPLITTVPTSPGAAEVQAYLDRQHERARSGQGWSWAIADAVSDVGIGQIGLWPLGGGRASVGYWLAPSARGRGLASLALTTVSEWALTLPGLARLEVYIEPWNEASWRAAERAGFEREGLLRSWQEVGGRRRDMYMYSLVPAVR